MVDSLVLQPKNAAWEILLGNRFLNGDIDLLELRRMKRRFNRWLLCRVEECEGQKKEVETHPKPVESKCSV